MGWRCVYVCVCALRVCVCVHALAFLALGFGESCSFQDSLVAQSRALWLRPVRGDDVDGKCGYLCSPYLGPGVRRVPPRPVEPLAGLS